MNIHTVSESKNPSYIYSKNKMGVMFSNVSEMEDTVLQDDVGIDVIFSKPHFINMPIWNAIINHIPP